MLTNNEIYLTGEIDNASTNKDTPTPISTPAVQKPQPPARPLPTPVTPSSAAPTQPPNPVPTLPPVSQSLSCGFVSPYKENYDPEYPDCTCKVMTETCNFMYVIHLLTCNYEHIEK